MLPRLKVAVRFFEKITRLFSFPDCSRSQVWSGPRVDAQQLYALTTLMANEQELSRRALHATIDVQRARDDAVHADETYWKLNGERGYYWVHCDARFAHFQFDRSRSGKVSHDVLGEHFTGTLVTAWYAGYGHHVR